MPKIELSVENPFVTKNSRPSRKSSLFARVYARLIVNKLNPGKIIPIFTFIKEDYKSFGAFTLNGGGSFSFFPDFYNLDNFDHLTLNTDFIHKKCHLTKIGLDGKHEKILNLEVSPLVGNNYYHLITFGMDTDDLLMDALPSLQIPDISYSTEEERLKYLGWITDSAYRQCTLNFPNGNGSFFIQILILQKGISVDKLAVERTFIEKLLITPTSLEGKKLMCIKIEIQTPEKSDFSICIITFRIDVKVRGSFAFFMAQDSMNSLPPCV